MGERDNLSTLARDDFWQLAQTAREQGKDLAEVLDRAGVLLTQARLRRIQADVLEDLAFMLAISSVHEWLPKSSGALSPQQVADLIRERIKALAEVTAQKGWRGP